MSRAARAGVLIYASDRDRLERFYTEVAGMRRLHADDHVAVLESDDLQLVLHRIPAHIAADIRIATPPERREDVAIKCFLTVPDLDEAGRRMAALGGALFDERWHGPDFAMCNAMDPEGNVFQVRTFD